MSMSHKAFVFDYEAFESQLRAILERALRTRDVGEIRAFIMANRAALRDPYEGEPLGADWEDLLERKDVDEYGDFALTRYYDPTRDIGLGDDWHEVPERMILGVPLVVEGRAFDPGKQGSYFQPPALVQAHLQALGADLEPVRKMLEAAAGKGLYVTF